jgi:hypothetical protein
VSAAGQGKQGVRRLDLLAACVSRLSAVSAVLVWNGATAAASLWAFWRAVCGHLFVSLQVGVVRSDVRYKGSCSGCMHCWHCRVRHADQGLGRRHCQWHWASRVATHGPGRLSMPHWCSVRAHACFTLSRIAACRRHVLLHRILELFSSTAGCLASTSQGCWCDINAALLCCRVVRCVLLSAHNNTGERRYPHMLLPACCGPSMS